MYKILILFFLITISSCQTINNISKQRQNRATVRSSADIFINKPETVKNIMVIFTNSTGQDGFDGIKTAFINKVSKKYTIVDNEDNADIVFRINVSQFYAVNDETSRQIQKSWQYNDMLDQIRPKDVKSAVVNIADNGAGVSTSENAGGFGVSPSSQSSADSSIFGRIGDNDFVTGMTIFGTLGFFATNSSPVGAAISAVIGGLISSSAQSYTNNTNFMTKVTIDISQKTQYSIEYNTKYVHKEDEGSIKWYIDNESKKAIHKRVSMYSITQKRHGNEQNAISEMSDKLASAISNGFIQ